MLNNTMREHSLFLRAAAVSIIALAGIGAQAQTYYYLDQIEVSPSSPTTADDITITVNGSLSSTAAFVANSAFGLNGTTVQLTVNAAVDGIGLDVLVPHSETFNIGNLVAGTYTISIVGMAILDMAPTPEHQFTVVGGTPPDCDSLDIISVLWDAFNPDRIIVVASNGSSDLFDYPGFVLLSTDGDTLAKETVNYFGIGQGPQSHVLDVFPGADIPSGSFTVDLHLWSGFYTEPECQWTTSWVLCPETECTTVLPYLWNLGNAIVEVDVPYVLENGDGQALSNGIFHLDPDSQGVYGTDVCLPPGWYVLRLDQVGNVGGQLYYGASTSMMNTEQIQVAYEQGTGLVETTFAFYEACINGTNGLPGLVSAAPPLVIVDGERLVVRTQDGSHIGAFQLLDINGRVLWTGAINAERGDIGISGLAHGAYVLRSERFGAARFIR